MKSRVKAYAKINLFLDITGRLPNGYHTLNTVMQQIDLYDVVDISVGENNGISVSCSVSAIPSDERNIAYRAADVFYRETGITPSVRINIEKYIPSEAGLGGSSTDGAAVLKALNGLYGNPLDNEKLLSVGASLGADVPFCLTGGTAVCGGIGEEISAVACKKDYVAGIVKPDFSCSTSAAYRAYDASPVPVRTGFELFAKALEGGAEGWCGGVYNVFERLYSDKRIAQITGKLMENGALAAALTGSGSAVFGIFTDKETAKRAVEDVGAPFSAVAGIL